MPSRKMHFDPSRRAFSIAAAAGACAPGLRPARADDFPSRPVHVVVPYAAGGGPDVSMRRLAPRLGEALGQQVVVENKVGAAGIIAAQVVAQAAPDGYTLLMGSNTHLIQKLLQPSAKFEPIKDFVPVTNVTAGPTVMVVRADGPYQKIDDVIAAARANPGKLNYGSGGIGTSAHLAGATFLALHDLKAVHVPLKGSVEISMSLVRGDTDFAFPVASTAIPEIAAGRVRPLGVTSQKRLKKLPDVPTMFELTRQPLMIQESWFGIWAPKGTPQPAVDRLFAAFSKVLADPHAQAELEAAGGVAAPSASPAEFATFVRSENEKWAQIVRLSAARAE